MYEFMTAFRGVLPIIGGLLYFSCMYAVVEWTMIRRRLFSDYQIKLIDFMWVSTSAVSLALLMISARDNVLKDRLSSQGPEVATIRAEWKRTVEQTIRASDECMDGVWPRGAVKGKSYKENGNVVRDDCKGVSFVSNYVRRMFLDENLWDLPPTLDAAKQFADESDRLFHAEFYEYFARAWSPPRSIDRDTLALEARDEYYAEALRIVDWKRSGVELAFQQKLVHALTVWGNAVWPFLLATALALRLGKSRLDLLAARATTQ